MAREHLRGCWPRTEPATGKRHGVRSSPERLGLPFSYRHSFVTTILRIFHTESAVQKKVVLSISTNSSEGF